MAAHVVYLLVLAASLCLQGGLALYGGRFRHLPTGRAFLAVTAGGALWTFLVGAMAVAEPAQARVLLSLKYIALSTTTVGTFVLVLALIGRPVRLRRGHLLALSAIPVLGWVCAWRDGWGMVRAITWGQSVNLTWVADIAFGPVYWLFTAYLYSLLLAGCAMLGLSIVRGGRLARSQSLALLVAIVVVMTSNVLLITGLADRRFDPMPVGLAISAVLLWWSTFRHRFLDLVPVARSVLVDALEDGVLVLDAQGRVVDVNATMTALLGDGARALLGQPLLADASPVSEPLRKVVREALARVRSTTVAPTPTAALLVDQATATPTDESPRLSMGGRTYDVRALAVGPDVKGAGARVILLHDVSALRSLVAEQARLIDQLQDALGQVRTLTGLLPICASCKQIRDDDGCWQPMESYIRARTDAEFSHGICPTCVDRHYPEYAAER